MSRKKGPQILTANDLLSGDIVYWTGSRWSRVHSEAHVFDEKEEAEGALAEAEDDEATVVSAFLAVVALDTNGRPVPGHYRDRIRATGPTIRYGKDAAADNALRQTG